MIKIKHKGANLTLCRGNELGYSNNEKYLVLMHNNHCMWTYAAGTWRETRPDIFHGITIPERVVKILFKFLRDDS